jgi:nitrogen fixation NifU-like protein
MTIYREIILDHAENPRNVGSIQNPTKSVTVSNLLCGDKIKMDILIKKNRIADIRFQGQGCAISRASSSLMTQWAKGKTKEELKKKTKKDMMDLLKIELGPNRIKCVLLPLEALQKLLI